MGPLGTHLRQEIRQRLQVSDNLFRPEAIRFLLREDLLDILKKHRPDTFFVLGLVERLYRFVGALPPPGQLGNRNERAPVIGCSVMQVCR